MFFVPVVIHSLNFLPGDMALPVSMAMTLFETIQSLHTTLFDVPQNGMS